MKKWIKTLIITVSTLSLVLFFGCSMFQDVVTPCYIEPDTIVYADEEATSFLPYTSLFDAERIDVRMDYAHQVNQLDLTRLIEDDSLLYSHLKGIQTPHIFAAKDLQRRIFAPDGAIGLLFPMITGGTLGALLIPRPGDKKKDA